MSILLIEDDATVRQALKDTLELFHYQVFDAANGPAALAVLREQPEPVDLVISDLVMPYMNALELYEALQQLQHGVKMLVVTGYPMPHTGMSLVQRSGVEWASKPIGMDQLAEAVRRMIGG